MDESDFQRIEATLTSDCAAAVGAFAASADNREVYALALDFHEDYGGPCLCLNTESGFASTVAANYANATEASLTGFHGVRWSSGDFVFRDLAPLSPSTTACLERYEIAAEAAAESDRRALVSRLATAIVTVIERLGAAMQALDRTRDFIAFAAAHDASEADRERLMRRTVAAPLFERVFARLVAKRALCADVARWPIERQVAFWGETLCGFALAERPFGADRLRAVDGDAQDATEALIALGPAAVADLVAMAEVHAPVEPARVALAWPQGRLGSAALLALEAIGAGPDGAVVRLHALLRRLVQRDAARAHSTCAHLAARVLHAFRPERFPLPDVSPTTNHVLNVGLYGL